MLSFHASSIINYFLSDIVGQRVFENIIAYMNIFTTSKVGLWFWGIFWSPLALGCGTFWSTLDLGHMSDWESGEWSDMYNMLMGSTFGIWVMVVPLPQLDFDNMEAEGMQWQYQYCSGSLAVEPMYFVRTCPGAWPRSRISWLSSKSSSSRSVDNVDCVVSSHLFLSIFWSLSLTCLINQIGDSCHPQYIAQR